MRARLLVVASCLVAVASACGSSGTGGAGSADGGSTDGGDTSDDGAALQQAEGGVASDGGVAKDGGVVGSGQAALLGAGMPQLVLGSATGGVLASPKLVAITYDSDPNRAGLEAFLPAFAGSVAWSATTKEYGVGPLTIGAPIHLTGSAPATLTNSNLLALVKAQGPLDPETIYMVFAPQGTVVTDTSNAKCCKSYDGFHSEVTVGATTAAWAVVCTCPGFDGSGVTTDLQQLTICAAHEAVEAATDPFTATVGWSSPDDPHVAWSLVTGGETADMCAEADTAYWSPQDLPGQYMAQRSWSNAAAAAGHDPCVGEPTHPYYNSIPELTDTVDLSAYGVVTNSKKIAVGATGTVKLHVYTDQDGAGPFRVTIDDWSGKGYITANNPTASFNAGDEISIDVTVNKVDPTYGNAEIFVVNTWMASGKGPTTYYWGMISQ